MNNEETNVIFIDLGKIDKDGQLLKESAKNLAEQMSIKELKEYLKCEKSGKR